MTQPVVSHHAIRRFQERVQPVSDDAATAALSSPAIIAAIDFGARFVRLGTGHRIVLRGRAVVTVLPDYVKRHQLKRRGL